MVKNDVGHHRMRYWLGIPTLFSSSPYHVAPSEIRRKSGEPFIVDWEERLLEKTMMT